MKKIYIANWKMNLLKKDVIDFLKKIKKRKYQSADLVLAPSFPYLNQVSDGLKNSAIKLAAQNVATQEKGAFTGEVSIKMLKDFGVRYVIIGHSERRQIFSETDSMINQKVKRVLETGMIPILCIGETQEEKNSGQRETVLVQQLRNSLSRVENLANKKVIIAYEPVWAIGTGNVVTESELDEAYRAIKRAISSLAGSNFFEEKVMFVYGGSVDEKNICDLKKIPYLQGFLVGGASLNVDRFLSLVNA
jgi:triosephosphate isomerase